MHHENFGIFGVFCYKNFGKQNIIAIFAEKTIKETLLLPVYMTQFI